MFFLGNISPSTSPIFNRIIDKTEAKHERADTNPCVIDECENTMAKLALDLAKCSNVEAAQIVMTFPKEETEDKKPTATTPKPKCKPKRKQRDHFANDHEGQLAQVAIWM